MPEARRIIKKVVVAHGHHGGAWKVAYADFVTAMMALFMVMWLLASTDAAARKEISNYFRTGVMPDGELAMNQAAQLKPALVPVSGTPPPEGQESFDDQTSTADLLARQLEAIANTDRELADVVKNVHIEVTPEGVLVEIVDEARGLLFDIASAELAQPLERFLVALAPVLERIGHPVEINGHTDARKFPAGSRMSNWDLSYQRAAAARALLVRHGLDERRVEGVFARGASKLYVKDQPHAPQNRRLSLLVKIAKTGDGKLAQLAN